MHNFFQRLSDTDSLTHNELHILKHILDDAHNVSQMSIHVLAEKVGFSTTTIIRLCKKLHFSGFSEFKYALQTYLNEPEKTDGNPPSYPLKANQVYQSIENTSLLVNEKDVHTIVNILKTNKRIHLFAGGLSMIAINYLEKLLFSAGLIYVYKYPTSRLATHTIDSFAENDVLFVISTGGNYPPLIKLVRVALARNVTVISITPHVQNDIADMATINLPFFMNFKENKGTEYTSRLPIFFLIKTILSSYLEESAERGTENDES